MDMFDPTGRKRKPSGQDARETLQKFLIDKKKAKTEETTNDVHEVVSKEEPLKVELPVPEADEEEACEKTIEERLQEERELHLMTAQQQAYLQSLEDEEYEPRRLFTLYDIKDDHTSQKSINARQKFRQTNIHMLIFTKERLFLATVCEYFGSSYDELIEYFKAIALNTNKDYRVDQQCYKAFMHTLKTFYYTEKGWRFELDLDEFFTGYLRRHRPDIKEKVDMHLAKAKAERCPTSTLTINVNDTFLRP